MNFHASEREALAIVVGGCALALAVIFATILLVRSGYGIGAVVLVFLIVWRESIFTGMRVELDGYRTQRKREEGDVIT